MDAAAGARIGAAARPGSAAPRRLAALLGLSLVVAGCGGAAPPDNPGDGGTGGQTQATPRPVTRSLADLLPTEVGGEQLTVQSGDGSDGLALLPQADVAAITEQLEGLRLTPERLSVAVAGDMATAGDEGGVAIMAVRVPGVVFTPSSGPLTNFVRGLLDIPSTARTARATLANKTTTTIVERGDTSRTTYVYGPTEVIFVARGPEDLVEEAMRHIPERP